MTAQGNALGHRPRRVQALQGRHIISFVAFICFALSGLDFVFLPTTRGVAPGYSCCAPLGLNFKNL